MLVSELRKIAPRALCATQQGAKQQASSKAQRRSEYGSAQRMPTWSSDAQFAGSSSVPAHVEMMGLIGAGNNPMVGMTVAVAVAIEEASK